MDPLLHAQQAHDPQGLICAPDGSALCAACIAGVLLSSQAYTIRQELFVRYAHFIPPPPLRAYSRLSQPARAQLKTLSGKCDGICAGGGRNLRAMLERSPLLLGELWLRRGASASLLASLVAALSAPSCDAGLASELEGLALALTAPRSGHDHDSMRDAGLGQVFSLLEDPACQPQARVRLLRALRRLLEQALASSQRVPALLQQRADGVVQASLASLNARGDSSLALEAALLLRVLAERGGAQLMPCLGASVDAMVRGVAAAAAVARGNDRAALISAALGLLAALTSRDLFSLCSPSCFPSVVKAVSCRSQRLTQSYPSFSF